MLANDLARGSADTVASYDPLIIFGTLTETACAVCLIVTKVFKDLPLLTAYIALIGVVDAIGGWVYMHGTADTYWHVFLAASSLEYLLQLGVMAEFIWKLLEEMRSFKWHTAVLCVIGITIMLAATAATVSASAAVYQLASADVRLFFRFDLGFGMFRCIVFLLIAGMAWVIGVRVHEHIGNIASYLSLYFAIVSAIQIAHEYRGSTSNQYNYYEVTECIRIGTWSVVMLLIGWYVIASARKRRSFVVEREMPDTLNQ